MGCMQVLDLTGAVLVTNEGARALAGCTELREAVLTWCAAPSHLLSRLNPTLPSMSRRRRHRCWGPRASPLPAGWQKLGPASLLLLLGSSQAAAALHGSVCRAVRQQSKCARGGDSVIIVWIPVQVHTADGRGDCAAGGGVPSIGAAQPARHPGHHRQARITLRLIVGFEADIFCSI